MMLKLFILLFGLTYSIDAFAIGMTIAVTVIGLSAGTFAAAAVAFAINIAVSVIISKVLAPSMPSIDFSSSFGSGGGGGGGGGGSGGGGSGASGAAGASPNPGNRQLIPPATDNKIPVVYGTAWVGGTIVDLSITSDSQKLYYVIALCEVTSTNQGQTPDTISFGTIYYGGKRVVFDGGTPYAVAQLVDDSNGIVDTTIAGKINIYLYSNGSNSPVNSGQSAISLMNSAGLISVWPNSKLMSNCAFAVIELTFSQTANVRGIDRTKFQVTNSRNSAGDCFYDYLINERYGAALPASQIDMESLEALNVYSNQNFTFVDFTGGITEQPRFKFNGIVGTTNTIMANLQDMSSCCDCLVKYNEIYAKWGVIVQSPAFEIAMDINDSNMISAITVSPVDIASSYNFVECKFPDNSNQDAFNAANFDLAIIDPALLYPNEPVNKVSLSLPLVNNSVQAQYIANRLLKSAREDLSIIVDINFIGIQLEAGDIVTVTNSNYGWAAKLFRLNQVNQTFTEDGAIIVKLMMTEYNPTVYDDVNITEFTPSSNTGIGDPLFFGNILAPFITTEGALAANPYISVYITTPQAGIVQYAEIYYSAFQNPDDTQRIFGGTTQIQSSGNPYPASAAIPTVNLANISAGNYYFFVRMVNSLGKSAYSPASLLVRWTPQTVQYEYRYVSIAYANDAIGTGFSLNPRNKTYYGIYNTATGNASLVIANYVWYQANPEAFETNNYVIYANRSNRKFTFAVDNAAVSGIGGSFVPTETTVYDPTLWAGLEDGVNVIDLDLRTGQLTKLGTSSVSTADGLLSVTNNTEGTMVVSLNKFLNFGNGIYSKNFNPTSLTIDIYGRVVGFESQDEFYYSDNIFTATSGQTVFTLTNIVGQSLVYRNSVLMPMEDYTETITDITLDTACVAGETIEIIVMRALSSFDSYDDLGISVDVVSPFTYSGLPFQELAAGDQLTFSNVGTPVVYTIATVNMATKEITFTVTPVGIAVDDNIYIFTGENTPYKPFYRYSFDATALSTYSSTIIDIRSGFEQLYANGSQFNEIDYDLTNNVFSGFPSPLTGKVDLIVYAPNNLGVPCSNVTNFVAYSINGSLTYNFASNPLAMQVFANGAMLVKGFDYTPNTSSYNLTLAFPNNFTLLNQQSYSRNGAA
jgi:hypothetical protein